MRVWSRAEPVLKASGPDRQEQTCLKMHLSIVFWKVTPGHQSAQTRLLGDSGPGSVNLSTVGIWGWGILCGEGCPGHCRVLSGTPGLQLLDVSSSPTPPSQVVTTNYVFGRCQMSPGGNRISTGCPRPSHHPPSGIGRAFLSPMVFSPLSAAKNSEDFKRE